MHPMGTRYRAERKQATSLIEECEAFLAGGLAERAFRTSGLVPDWSWTNLLAHGTYAELLSERDTRPRIRRSELSESGHWFNHLERWRRARSYLAAEVLEVAGSQGQLEEMQRRTLLPLEEELGACQGVGVYDPRDWVNLVVAALDEYRQYDKRMRRSQQHRPE
jgi:hypothetical protein